MHPNNILGAQDLVALAIPVLNAIDDHCSYPEERGSGRIEIGVW